MERGGTALLLWLGLAGVAVARAETVEIFAAGSLRGVVGELAKEAAVSYNIDVKPTFGGSGSLRERS